MENILQNETPLSQSILWDLQTAFYDQVNIKAWSEAIVPNFVTSNSFIAQCYARVVLSFAQDWFSRSPSANLDQPIFIIEIGAGHGKFSYLLLKKLIELREFWPHENCFKYIMTDFTQNNLDFWAAHKPFNELLEAGLLDFALFNAETDTQLQLVNSGHVIATSGSDNPIVMVCNYLFDTVKQDAFRILGGRLQEALCTVVSNSRESNPLDPDVIRRIHCRWSYRDSSDDFYDDSDFNSILKTYLEHHDNASILIPIGGLRVIRNMLRLSNGRMLLLSGDKAYNHEEEVVGLRDPHIAIHGSFSFMVNFHAIRLYALQRGGFSMHSPYLEGFKCSGFVFGGEDHAFPSTRLAFRDHLEDFGPENFSTLQRCVKDESASPSLKNALALLRLSGFDTDVFYKFKQVFIDRTPYASEKAQKDIRRDIVKMYSFYYPLQKTKDISFEVGRIFMGLKDYETAIRYFEDSIEYCGEHNVIWYNIGISQNYLGNLNVALQCFQRALELRPDYHDARSWFSRIENKLKAIQENEESAKIDN